MGPEAVRRRTRQRAPIQSHTWEAEDGSKRTVVEIEAEEVAASLRWAAVKLTKARKAGGADWVPDEGPVRDAPAE